MFNIKYDTLSYKHNIFVIFDGYKQTGLILKLRMVHNTFIIIQLKHIYCLF